VERKYRKFYVDWWQIKRSTIYSGVAIFLFLGVTLGGGWWLYRNDFFLGKQETAEMPKDAARIVSFEGDVRIIRAATRETILVTRTTFVTAGDTIQTQADGRAQVQMIDGSTLSIRPNSTVVIRDSTSIFGGTNVRVSLDGGQINVKTQGQTEQTENVVEVRESENRLFPQTDANFKINEQTSGGEIRISRGGVETTLGGEKTTIGENEYATVNGSKLSARERLLAPPRLVSPANAEQIVDSNGSGVTVNFTWLDPEGNPAANFYLQVAKSSTFVTDSIMVDRSGMPSRDFRLAGLSPGAYYWRVKATARSGQTTN